MNRGFSAVKLVSIVFCLVLLAFCCKGQVTDEENTETETLLGLQNAYVNRTRLCSGNEATSADGCESNPYHFRDFYVQEVRFTERYV